MSFLRLSLRTNTRIFAQIMKKKTELRLDMYKSCNRLSDLKQCSETYCTRHSKGTLIYILPYVAIFGIWRPPVRVDVKVGSGLT